MKTRSEWFCWKLRMLDARRNNHHCHVQENNLITKSRERAQQVRHVGWQSLFHNVICTNRVRELVVATGMDFCDIQCHCSCVGHEERGREFVPLDGGLLLLPCLLFYLCPTVQAHTLKGFWGDGSSSLVHASSRKGRWCNCQQQGRSSLLLSKATLESDSSRRKSRSSVFSVSEMVVGHYT